MCLLGPSGHCYLPVVTPVAFCPGGGSPASGLGLPSSCQGSLWLLEHRRDSEGDGAPSCRPGACTVGGAPWSCREPCDPAAAAGTTTRGARGTASGGPRHGPQAQTAGGRTTRAGGALIPRAPAARRTLADGPQGLGRRSSAPRSSRPLPHCRPSSLGGRGYQTWGFTPGGFSPSCGAASGCQSPTYWVRNCPSPRYRPVSCAPPRYLPSSLGGCLSCVPSSFPPLRYLRPGCY
ncbi:keratin-associated protein 24-1 [Phyllostomus discolor]|uniref:Keratin-associated protein 24-1 n=1 Tax=Phyllostomus discolor TaxID=89673 RepID=A0A6J2KYJ4_9CHIR|nr:keratin-associated protein 24-1 [Phyllostomus discolor]